VVITPDVSWRRCKELQAAESAAQAAVAKHVDEGVRQALSKIA